MKRLAFLLLLGLHVHAASSLWVDISGPWRWTSGNSPDMARPDYDDRNWLTTHLPLTEGSDLDGSRIKVVRRLSGWLRRSVDLPDWADRGSLALTLGPFRSVYEVYVNGIQIARVGNFETRATSTVARTRSFPIPREAAGSEGPIQIAIHFDWYMGGGRYLQADQAAPYLLTYLENAPRRAGEEDLLALRARFSPATIFGTAYLLFGMLILLVWFGGWRSPELPWFAASLILSSLNRWLLPYELRPGAHPFNYAGVPSIEIATQAIAWTCFGSFVIAATGLRLRWAHAVLWTACGVFVALAFARGSFIGYLGIGALSGFAGMAAVTFAWWKEGKRKTHFRRLLFASLFLVSAYRLWLNTLGDAQGYASVTDYYVALPDVFTLALTIAITGLLMRQVALSRRDHQVLQTEMDAARQAQLYLLSGNEPVATGKFQADEIYRPALQVGGDFHWSRLNPDGSLTVAVGDVSGKGLKAALQVSVAIGILRNLPPSRPAALLAALNAGLTGRTGGGFVTCCCARCGEDGNATAASAGHPAPYVDGDELSMEAGLPLGLAPDVIYVETHFELGVGEQVTLVSDGVVEAANAKAELFGFERAREISTRTAAEIAEAAQAWGQNDDITVVTVRRTAA